MAYKFIVLAAFVACASAGVIQTGVPVVGPVAYTAPVAKTVVTSTVDTEHDPHPQYSYSYDVHDSLTGDSKAQHESRDGDVVHGSYSVVDPDGTKRTVDYTADDVNGFNAVVSKEPATVVAKTVAAAPAAPVVAKVHAEPVVHAAPAVATYAAAPLVAKYHAAPAVATYAAPVVHHAYHAAPAAYTTYAAAAPLVAKYHAAPAAYTTYAAAAPVVHHAYHAAPATYTSYAAAPLVAKYHAAPAAYY